jgi:hypothetical protein
MLGINPEKVSDISSKARMFDCKEEDSDPDSGSNRADDGMVDVLEDTGDDASYQELVEYIRSLDGEEQVNLVASAWVGRGTYEPSEWEEALSEAHHAHNERTAEYLTGPCW